MRTARGRRRTWRAARKAAEQVCDGKRPGVLPMRQKERNREEGSGSKGGIEKEESNTLHVVFHFPTATITNTTPATATAAATQQHQ